MIASGVHSSSPIPDKLSTNRDSQFSRLAHNFGMGRMDNCASYRIGAVTVRFASLLAAATLAGLVAGLPAAAEPRAVMELFTSQGCSSCPPADKLLGELAERDDLLALSLPVDYWDYLGWKDTLASHDYSERQREYAQSRGDGEVYTPQAVINGNQNVVGSDRAAVETALKQAAEQGFPVSIGLTTDADAVTVKIGAAAGATPNRGTIWLVMYDRSVSVPIERGENSGRTLIYSNVVRKLRPIAMWRGEAMSIDLPRSEMNQAKVARCAVLLQSEKPGGLPGPILGAASIYYEH